ncbi:AMP-binding protein [Treponema sp.]|uniref:AMP-binding protein n=1 Tax=Treponema sp. TaxID=166 RepID=UPI00298DA861|nr:AMP-binding protein [Treponema sp.]MCR5613026.1 AMP-binding protein [Treponema sp.]
MKAFLKVFITIISILYPVLVFTLLVVYKMPVRIVSLCVVFLALVYFLSATSVKSEPDKSSAEKSRKLKFNIRPLVSSIFLLAIGIFCYITNSSLFLKLYPVVICVTLLFVFGITIFTKPNIIFRFATLQDKTIRGSINERRVEKYCLKVTYVWCIYFILNSLVAAYTAFFCDEKIWTIYNCGISYGIMGMIFAVEFIVRSVVNKNMPKLYPISKFTADSRKDDFIMCYEDTWSSKKYKTWKDFLTDSAKMRRFITDNGAAKWILHSDDYWYFICSYVALLQCRKEVALTANISEEFIKEMREEGTQFITDSKDAKDSIYIPEIIAKAQEPSENEIRSTPAINADETKIFMFTSGSTGKPKSVLQRLTEFELDNEFIFSLWGDEFLKRKLVATLSQHHIYGLLFSAMLPFAAGIPFRRFRIEFPTEFEKLTDESYFIVAVPAFLKRTVEVEEKLNLKSPFITTSGGVLLPEVAKKTEEVFGFWPMEVYGSTETSGIAYRQSKNGPEWTPFANAQISKNEEGCLNIKSPYIKDPAGFQTADLVDIYDDGRFLLKGRADSIVKIEEKRISLTEVENRLLQTGLVKDVCVVAMSDRRQYLAAALVFNDKGKEKFKDWKKFDINMFFHDYLLDFFENVVLPKKWRYLDELPMDLQGKKKKLDIQALFTKN